MGEEIKKKNFSRCSSCVNIRHSISVYMVTLKIVYSTVITNPDLLREDETKVPRQFSLKLFLNIFFLCCVICQVVASHWNNLSATMINQIFNWFDILTLIAYNVCLHVGFYKSQEIVGFTNGFLKKYNSNSENQTSAMKEKMAKYVGGIYRKLANRRQ